MKKRKMSSAEMNKYLEKQRKPVRGIFRNYYEPGKKMAFKYKLDKDGAEEYELEDGKEYSLPLCVVNHLKEDGFYYEDSKIVKADGSPIGDSEKRVNYYGFDSLEVEDI